MLTAHSRLVLTVTVALATTLATVSACSSGSSAGGTGPRPTRSAAAPTATYLACGARGPDELLPEYAGLTQEDAETLASEQALTTRVVGQTASATPSRWTCARTG